MPEPHTQLVSLLWWMSGSQIGMKERKGEAREEESDKKKHKTDEIVKKRKEIKLLFPFLVTSFLDLCHFFFFLIFVNRGIKAISHHRVQRPLKTRFHSSSWCRSGSVKS